MKITLTFSIIFLSLIVYGQELKLVEVESNQIIAVDAEQTWRIINNWENLNTLVPKVVKSTTVNGVGINSTWEIHLVNGGSITEKMIYYNSSEKVMSYVMTETPMPIENYRAIIKIESYGLSKSLVSFYTSCNTSQENFDKIKNTFQVFQETYLSNIEKNKK